MQEIGFVPAARWQWLHSFPQLFLFFVLAFDYDSIIEEVLEFFDLERLFRAQSVNIIRYAAMPKGRSLESTMGKASELEKDYDWLGAVEFYEKASDLVTENDFLRIGEIQEKIGYAFYRAAMQAESVDQFRERMRQSVADYERAKELYGRLRESGKTPRMLRCDAMIAYIGYWLATEVHERKRLLDECWRLTDGSLKAFKNAGVGWEFAKTFNQLSTSACLSLFVEWSPQRREKITREALRHGEQAVRFLTVLKEPHELAKALARTGILHSELTSLLTDLIEEEKCWQKARECITKAKELSEEIAVIELLYIFVEPFWGMKGGTEEALGYSKKALEYVRRTRDKLVIGWTLDWLAYCICWKMFAIEDPDVRTELKNQAMRYAEDARLQYYPICFISPRSGVLWTQAPETESYSVQAQFETGSNKRRELLRKAIENAPNLLKQAANSGYPSLRLYAHHTIGKALASLAQTETDIEKKKKSLEKALYHRSATIRLGKHIFAQARGVTCWTLGVMYSYLGDLKSELADLAKDLATKKNILQEAVMNKETALELCYKSQFFEAKDALPQLASLGRYQYQYGSLLNHLYDCTHNGKHREKAAEAFKDSAESFQKAGQASRVAESYWKAAQAYDSLGDYTKAAENFGTASTSYQRAAEKVKRLKEFYKEHSIYMQAWCQIEEAKHHHMRQKYDLAKECFEKASEMHESLKQWSYLAPNYSAWAHVENAEHLSREDKPTDAIEAFKKAAKLFAETKASLKAELVKIEDADEKKMTANLVRSADLRCEYCMGRIPLEEARILDRKGDHYSSSQKYGAAAEIFEKILTELESEQEKREIKLITTLSRAWQMMTRAESEASPEFYSEASQLFEEVKELGLNERAKMLALGHSRFCRALEAGAKFADAGDKTYHAAAIQHLESATKYYARAGAKDASEYARATELLFDAYIYMDNAKRENDPWEKAKLYKMTEKVLQTSVDSFSKAGHPEKRELVLRLLENVKEERELVLTLSWLLQAPSIVSTTTAFNTPAPTQESAVGSERFEHAKIQAYLTAPEEVTTEETFEIRLDMANVAREHGLIVRIESLVPSNFRITETTPNYKCEDSSIDMKGKRLAPQKIESIRIRAIASESGTAHLSPKIVYVDELGEFRTCLPDPVVISVYPPGKFQFKTNNAQKVFECLTRAFAEDYMKRRLTQEKSGWRTLMQVVKDAKISKKSVYGTATRKGSAISELERRGVVELRMFLGERGRGGKITKARIAYEKDMIKRYIDQQVMKQGENRGK